MNNFMNNYHELIKEFKSKYSKIDSIACFN